MARERIWTRARLDLILRNERGDQDIFLFEHSARMAHCAELICDLPEVRVGGLDLLAITAAALYLESAWVSRWRAGECDRLEILVKPVNSSLREESASYLETRLADVIPPDSLQLASRTIRCISDPPLAFPEGRIVSDALNLEEFGVASLWPMIRRAAYEGKAVQAALDAWRTRRAYSFWPARLQDSFHYAPVRQIAQERLASVDRLMTDLAEHSEADDVRRFTAKVPTAPHIDQVKSISERIRR